MTSDIIALYNIMLQSDPKWTEIKRGKRLTGTGMSFLYHIHSNVEQVSVVLAPGRNKASEYEKYL